jgi:hypothetical protein
MFKEKEISDILSLYESILKTRTINEVSTSSSSLFGGKTVRIPADGAHSGQSGWQSNNAWDIMGVVGTPVYAIANGTVITYNDYGPTPIKKDGKTLFGAGFTVNSDGGLPDVYYTHLKDVKVKQGSKIQCGQLIGYVTDFPNNSSDHVHIGVETGNIDQFLNDDGTLKCSKGEIEGQSSDTSTQSGEVTTTDVSSKNPYLYNIATDIGSNVLPKTENRQIKENFGKNFKNRYGRIILPKEDNLKIKSPINGIVYNKRFNSNCENQITIKNDDNEVFYLEFCGITSPRVKDGSLVSIGDVLGETKNDVEITMYSSSWNKIHIDNNTFSKKLKQTTNKKNKEISSPFEKEKTQSKPVDDNVGDNPILSAFVNLPVKMFDTVFGDRYDKKTGEMTQKRWGGVGDKQPVDPWIKDFIKNPFGRKKVTENIERIKKLL